MNDLIDVLNVDCQVEPDKRNEQKVMSQENRKKVIYIIGVGRSGSTILDILLGNGEDILSGGEINRYIVRQGIPSYWCHIENSPTFLFWNKIGTHLKDKFPEGIEFTQLKQLSKKHEYHTGIFNLGFDKKEWNRYSHFVSSLYETIFENIKQSTIIDSSKYPYRALKLVNILPYEIQFIYLKRDPRNVVKSFAKKGIPHVSKSWLSANLFYLLVNLLCQFVVYRLKKKHQVVEVKYEALIGQPVETLTLIQDELQINLEPVIEKVKRDEFLTVGPLFEGNRMRMTDKVKLETKLSSCPKTIKNRLTRLINFMVYR